MSFQQVAEAAGLSLHYPPEVEAEVDAYLAAPGLDDPALVDRTALPFVTIDGPGTRDLDQAIYVEARAGGFRLRYAIADASYYVRPGTALHTEALRRGASYYLPGLSVPMLPRALSEGLVSIGPNVDRRALIFDVEFDGRGTVTDFKLERARVRSRGKLTFEGVQAFVDGKAKVPGPRAIGPSLLAIAALGELRCKHEDRAQMVRYLRPETTVRLDADGSLVISSEPRTAIELANEQISILCNALGGRFLQGGPPELVQPIFRVHEPPEPERIAGFERLVAAVAKSRGLPDDPWLYRRAADQGMAGYLQHLPISGPGGRLARALHRQAMLLNGRSVFDAEPRAHFGVGEQIYSRFTAPMREIVGIQCHAQAIDRMVGKSPRTRAEDEAVRAQVIEAGNRSKDQQRLLNREIDAHVIAAVLGPELRPPFEQRVRHTGTIVGFAPGRIHVVLDHPPLDVRVPLIEQGKLEGGAWLTVVDDGARLARKDGTTVCRLGDEVQVVAVAPEVVVIATVVKPLPEFHDEVVDAASAALRAWLPRFRAAHPGPLDAVALYTDDGALTVCPAASTVADQAARVAALGPRKRAEADDYRWSVGEWADDVAAPEFDVLCTRVRAQAQAHKDGFAAFRAMLHEAMMTALEDADTHGLFDGQRAARFVTITDSADAAGLERESAERLNHDGEAAALLAYLAR